MFIKPDIQKGESYTGAVFECIEAAWANNSILLMEAIRDAANAGDFPMALVMARELDRQKGLPFRGPTLKIPPNGSARDGPQRCPCCDKRLHPRITDNEERKDIHHRGAETQRQTKEINR